MSRAAATAIIVAVMLVSLAFASPAAACLWDTDTLLEERRGMPEIAAILAGKWERHSTFFYEQRIAASRKTLEADPKNLAAMDDLAVALEKTGHINEAIDVMRRKLEIDPAGYTTHANLGTFYLHAGDFDAGITHIKRALEINPDAHFGRERYQLMVAEFIRDGKANPAVFESGSFVLPLIIGEQDSRKLVGDEAYYKMLTQHRENVYRGRGRDNPEVGKAIEGVVGMIRFGTGTSPDLFFALGDLLAAREDRHLAYRAYHRALELGHRDPELARKAMESMRGFHEDTSNFRDEVIAAERSDGAAWVAAYQKYEDDLLRAGRDTSDTAQFAAFYSKHGDPRAKPSAFAASIASLRANVRHNPLTLVPLGGGVLLVLVIVVTLWRRAGRRGARAALTPITTE